MNNHLTLATDLDGTFLGTQGDEHRQLYQYFDDDNRQNKTLIFVTGRGLESVYPLLNDPIIPKPDFIIADVGATIVDGKFLEPIHPLQGEVQKKWPGIPAILEATKHLRGITRQNVPQERRCSFFATKGKIPSEIFSIADEMDCDVLFSADRYLDILPRGVSKGSTLTQLIEFLKLDPHFVVVAGDTLNDLSLFKTPYSGVAVGNSEPDLVKQIRDLKKVYLARKEGTAGIWEGLVHYGFVKPSPLPKTPTPVIEPNEDRQLVIVYHRLPFAEIEKNGQYFKNSHESPNGIIPTLLRFFADGREGMWVAWSKSKDRKAITQLSELQPDASVYPKLSLSRVWLTADDVETFYQRFSKEAFWPLLHSFPDKIEFHTAHWQHFVEINRLFAEQVSQDAKPGAVIWIHDYNLWMVPGFLRKFRPDLIILFFHHTPFPSSDAFSIIPWRRDILGSLIQCDYVGFHIPRYVENFVDCLRSQGPVEVLEQQSCAPRYLVTGSALGVTTQTTKVKVVENELRVGANPVGIDVKFIKQLLATPAVKQQIEEIKKHGKGKQTILSVERLDYTKGPLEKLKAFELFLEKYPEYHEKIELVSICTPPNPRMQVYRTIRSGVDQAIGRINGRFSTYQWTPVRYFFQTFSFEEVLAYYAAADIAWVTPLRDGLNLVAKEYVATKGLTNAPGVLILSEFAGAAAELHGALLTNPYDVTDMIRVLKRALELKPETKDLQMKRLFQIVGLYDIEHWANSFMETIAAIKR